MQKLPMYPHISQFETRDRELERRIELIRVYRERGRPTFAGRRRRLLLARLVRRWLPASPETTTHVKETS
jgi:hypothetical protein